MGDSYARCLFCGSDTNLILPEIAPKTWATPFEKKSDSVDAWVGWGALGYLARNLGRQHETVVCGGMLEQTPGWKQLLVELTKSVVKNGWLHLETARPTVAAQTQFAQVISPVVLQAEFKTLGLSIINWEFTEDRQSYWLQKMDEVFIP